MPKRFPEEFRRKVLDLVAAGRPIAQIAADLNISDQTIYAWRKQEPIDCGSPTTQKAVRGHSHYGRRRTSGAGRVPAFRSDRLGLLRIAQSGALSSGRPPCLADRADPRRAHCLSWHLRCPPGARRTAPRVGSTGRLQPGRDADGPRDHQGPARYSSSPAPPRDAHGDGSG